MWYFSSVASYIKRPRRSRRTLEQFDFPMTPLVRDIAPAAALLACRGIRVLGEWQNGVHERLVSFLRQRFDRSRLRFRLLLRVGAERSTLYFRRSMPLADTKESQLRSHTMLRERLSQGCRKFGRVSCSCSWPAIYVVIL